MTTTELRQVLDWADEGKLQYHHVKNGWIDFEYPTLVNTSMDVALSDRFYFFRRKPEPTIRAWKPEEVPVGALLCYKHDSIHLSRGMIIHCNGCMVWHTFTPGVAREIESLREFNYSTDDGATWKPCGVIQ